MNLTGLYRALVVDNVDPEGLARIRVQVPQLLGGNTSGWARPVPAGVTTPPSVGEQVWVSFEGGDAAFPLYHYGATSSGASTAYVDAGDAATLSSAESYAAAQDAAHVAASDPHPQYLTPTEGDAAYVNVSGDTMTGDLTLPNAPTAAGHATRKDYVDTQDGLALPKSGGTMSGAIAMGTNKVTGMGDPTTAQDAATKNYVDTQDSAHTAASDPHPQYALDTDLTTRMPAGAITMWATGSAPTGWLICDGSAVSRSTYATLYAIIGTTYGVGDGSTTFNLPNLKGRVPVGQDTGQTEFDVLGETGGEKAHTLSAAESGVAAHSHTVTDPGHFHTTQTFLTDTGSGDSAPQRISVQTSDISFASAGNTNVKTTGVTVDNATAAAASAAHNNLQPYIVLNYIIKA